MRKMNKMKLSKAQIKNMLGVLKTVSQFAIESKMIITPDNIIMQGFDGTNTQYFYVKIDKTFFTEYECTETNEIRFSVEDVNTKLKKCNDETEILIDNNSIKITSGGKKEFVSMLIDDIAVRTYDPESKTWDIEISGNTADILGSLSDVSLSKEVQNCLMTFDNEKIMFEVKGLAFGGGKSILKNEVSYLKPYTGNTFTNRYQISFIQKALPKEIDRVVIKTSFNAPLLTMFDSGGLSMFFVTAPMTGDE